MDRKCQTPIVFLADVARAGDMEGMFSVTVKFDSRAIGPEFSLSEFVNLVHLQLASLGCNFLFEEVVPNALFISFAEVPTNNIISKMIPD